MPEPTSDKHYEEEFEFPLWKQIKEYAEKNDVSYTKACGVVMPEYVKTIRYNDKEYENGLIAERHKQLEAIHARLNHNTDEGK